MKKLDIIYEDKRIIVVNKPSGVLTISDGKISNTLYSEVREYVKKKNKNNKIFIVHRLDKDTSGIVLFAKDEKLKNYLQDNWNDICVLREYMAVVEGIPLKTCDRLEDYLKESKTYQVYVTEDKRNGKKAITNYEVIKSSKKYSLLRVWIETGRKNQIRAQLANMGNPICGDKKYNASTNPLRRLTLHASKLVININGEVMEFSSSIRDFDKIL